MGVFWRWLTRAHRHQPAIITRQCFCHARLDEYLARQADLERRVEKLENARSADIARDRIIAEAAGVPVTPEVPDLYATGPLPAVSLQVIHGEGHGGSGHRQSA